MMEFSTVIPMSPAPLRVAVAGLGFGRKVIVPAVRATASTTVAALWHPDPHKAGGGCPGGGGAGVQ